MAKIMKAKLRKSDEHSEIKRYADNLSKIDDNTFTFFKDVLAKSLRDREYSTKLIQSRLKSDHFPRKYMSWVFNSIKDFLNNPKYGSRLPTKSILFDKLKSDKDLDKETKVLYAKKLEDLYSHKIHHEEYSMEVIENKISLKEFKQSIEHTLKNISPDNINKTINDFVSRSFKISNKNNFQIVDLYSEAQKRQKHRNYIKKNPGKFKRFHFNLKSVDDCLPGGLMAPMMASIAAKTGRGKSIFTVWIGDSASKQKFNVTHITSENDNFQTTGRYDSKITGLKYDDIQLSKLSGKSRKKYSKIYSKRLKNLKYGKIKIVKFPPNDFNASSIQHIINMLESEGHKTDLLIVDSPDLMQSVVPNIKDKRLQQAAIYWELKCVLEAKNCIGFVTTQLTKMSSDENPLAEDLSEAYDKARMLDFLMIYTQSKTQKSASEASLFIAKNRDGKSSIEPTDIITHFSRMNFVEKPPEESIDDDLPKKISTDKSGKKKSGKDESPTTDDPNLDKLRAISKAKSKKKKKNKPDKIKIEKNK